MENNEIFLPIAGSIIATLLSIVGYFTIRLISKIDKMDEKIDDIDKSIVFNSKQFLHLDESLRKEIKKNYEAMSELVTQAIYLDKENVINIQLALESVQKELHDFKVMVARINQVEIRLEKAESDFGRVIHLVDYHDSLLKKLKK